MARNTKISISSGPFLHHKASTPAIMWEFLISLLPVLGAAYFFFGMSAILVSLASILGCLAAEWIFGNSEPKGKSLWDGSGLITGILLALTLPPGFPLWMAFIGGVVAIGMGKMIWGGLGQNIFNPALLGRAFLQATFPTAITTWSNPDGRYFLPRGTNLSLPFFKGEPLDAVSGATPLSRFKFDHEPTAILDLFVGNISGSLGETCALLILLIGVYLSIRKIINWRIPVSILLTVAVFSEILYLVNPEKFAPPFFMMFAGGLLLGAVFMATDLVTSPLSPRGIWIFGFGTGFLVVLIRVWGGLPEGIMYAILLMNALTPIINKLVKTRVYGY
jgi:electron transport complex protein RnfD